MEVLNLLGGGKPLPKLANPAAAAQILNTYQAIDGDGNVMTGTAGAGITNPATAAQILSGYQAMLADGSTAAGTYAPYYEQYLTQSCTSSSRDTTCTFTATGGTIDAAAVWLSYSGNVIGHSAIVVDGVSRQAKCGENTLSRITSVSGNVITAICKAADVSNWGSLVMNCKIVSH